MRRCRGSEGDFVKTITVNAAIVLAISTFFLVSCAQQQSGSPEPNEQSIVVPRSILPDPRETHFGELRMLTDGGENAEAYFSFDSSRLIFQSTRPPFDCDQIFVLGVDGGEPELASTGLGRTTCAYFMPGDQRVLYASTHLGKPECPPKPDYSRGYVWPIDPNYDIYTARPDGSDVEKLTDTAGYDAEATVSPLGDRIVFTSMRDGDLDIYSMNLDGTDVVRLTDEIGYDGGPFFSPDGTTIVYRARHPSDPEEIRDYQALLADGLIRPSKLEVWVMDADGSNKRPITDLGVAAFAPFFDPSGTRIIFSSNYGDPTGREFDLFMVNIDGTGLEQITFSEGFDGFPMWAPDGKTFVFCSNRHNSQQGETNVFVTTWQE
jgi:Tol biopolymer transport system component